jgi:type II secretory pathway component PulC
MKTHYVATIICCLTLLLSSCSSWHSPPGSETRALSKKELNSRYKDLNEIFGHARVIKIDNQDGTFAYKLIELVPHGFFDYLALADQDIITNLNGKPFKNDLEFFNFIIAMKDQQPFSLGLKRKGSPRILHYSIRE